MRYCVQPDFGSDGEGGVLLRTERALQFATSFRRTRTTDTCPLVTIQAVSTERIEVYPMGMTSRPGYPSSGHGLILIFLARADTADST